MIKSSNLHTQAHAQHHHHAVGVLSFDCVEHLGVINAVTVFFNACDIAITRLDSITDAGHLFVRLEWNLSEQWADEDAFDAAFSQLRKDYQINYQVCLFKTRQTLGLFVSGDASALIAKLTTPDYRYTNLLEITFLLSDDRALQAVADRYGLPIFFVENSQDTLTYEKELLKIISRYKPDYLGLVGYSGDPSVYFIQNLSCPVIRSDYSYLLSNVRGQGDQEALERGAKLVGATAQYVTPTVEVGPVIAQAVQYFANAENLTQRMQIAQNVSHEVFVNAMLKVLEYKVRVVRHRTIVFS